MIGRRSHDAQSFEEAWSGGTPRDEHVAELVRFAEDLCEAAAVTAPSAAFRDSLRAQLMTEAATVLVPMPAAVRPAVTTPSSARAVRRRVVTVTTALVASAGAVGIVASSASAVPGEMLYPVKRSVESVELQLHRDDASRGSFQLAQASERLAEARRLSADGRSADLIESTLDDFASAAADGSSKLFTVYSSTGEEQPIRQVNDFVAASSIDLSALSTDLPDEVAESFTAASDAITDLATEASSLCGSCAPADVQALVSSVTDLAKPAADAAPKAAAKPSPTPAARTTAPPAATTYAPARSTPTPAPAAATTPAPAATTKAPPLSGITDPLLGGLLGNDDQVGLVPGLLNGLLGGGKPAS